MTVLWMVFSSVAAAAPCETAFEFVGQPVCVELSYADGSTAITNRCEHPVLVDQSVQQGFSILSTDQSSTIKDLSAFTLGMNGQLYRAVAQAHEVCADTQVSKAKGATAVES